MSVTTKKSGKVVKVTRDVSHTIRMSVEERDEFNACVILDAAMHGGEANASVVVRRLMREFCRKVKATSESEVARDAAKVLKKRAA
jgi:predicted deacylase